MTTHPWLDESGGQTSMMTLSFKKKQQQKKKSIQNRSEHVFYSIESPAGCKINPLPLALKATGGFEPFL